MKNNTRQTLKIYWQHSVKYPRALFFSIVCAIGASLASVVTPLFFKQLVDVLSLGIKDAPAIHSSLVALFFIASSLFIEFVFWRINGFVGIWLESLVMADLSRTCFNYMHKHSFAYFSNNFVGSLVKRVNWFTRGFEGMADRIMYNLTPTLTVLIVAIIVLAYKNLYLGLFMFGWFVVFMVFNGIFTMYKIKFDIARSSAESESTAILADTITNHTNVKLFCGYNREVGLFSWVSDKVKKLRRKAWNLDATIHAVQGLLMVSFEVGIFYYAIRLWQNNLFTIGDFVLLQTYIILIFDRIWNLSNVIRQLYQDLADAEEMTVILQTTHEIQDVINAKDLVIKDGEIEFRNVTFSYNQTREIIDEFNLIVKPKEKLGVVGPSGAGKTTIIKLILRMFELSGGKILIDGQNVAKVTQESLWLSASMVPQDPILFHRTLMENIRYGKPDATDEEVFVAARLAHCHEFISGFPDGYSTYVGERGMKLSGGERQRVAIARAILRNAPILILDEATSSLDSESERLIQDALDNLMQNKTVIVIAHRLSTIMKMDRIVVIDDGRIVEEGTHVKLLRRRDGVYKRLWNLQAGGFIQ